MVAKARGGFFGKIISGLSSVFKPIVSGIGNVVGGLFSGAKTQATQVAHRAVASTAQAAQEALRTGDVKGAAKRAIERTKRDAEETARKEYARGKAEAKAEATKRIAEAHARASSQMESRFGQYRSHPGWGRQGYGPPNRGYRQQVPQYGRFFGAGFGKKHFKKIEKAAHKHIDKIYSEAHKHTKKATAHVKKNGKSGAAEAKRMAKAGIHTAHKAAGAGFRASLAQIKKEIAADIAKKGAKVKKVPKKKGAGVKVGAGVTRKKGGLVNISPKLMAALFKNKKGKKGSGVPKGILAMLKKKFPAKLAGGTTGAGTKVGAGTSVGAGVKKKKKRGGMHMMRRGKRGVLWQ